MSGERTLHRAVRPLCFHRALGDGGAVVVPEPPLGWWVAAPKHDALVGGLPAAVTGAVVDDVGLTARGINADSKAYKLVVPGDPGLAGGLPRGPPR